MRPSIETRPADLYARVESENQPGETLVETLERLVDDYTLLDFADDMADLSEHHWDPEALEDELETADRESRTGLDEPLPWFSTPSFSDS
ncbi:hypothetical protein [Halobellus litoreus]|uniref:Uncharacterized protein n=1 Tax=Halobellus litoreus TaxID=755310 RepID=A0ABD6E197_9EURY|nr:hypothetical protein [Halobellus litoreus]